LGKLSFPRAKHRAPGGNPEREKSFQKDLFLEASSWDFWVVHRKCGNVTTGRELEWRGEDDPVKNVGVHDIYTAKRQRPEENRKAGRHKPGLLGMNWSLAAVALKGSRDDPKRKSIVKTQRLSRNGGKVHQAKGTYGHRDLREFLGEIKQHKMKGKGSAPIFSHTNNTFQWKWQGTEFLETNSAKETIFAAWLPFFCSRAFENKTGAKGKTT